ncbi:MAG: M28 family peptidase [Planctomycetes bacterium]|nr:M28 family peptidase [Planctomycetota bacterium]
MSDRKTDIPSFTAVRLFLLALFLLPCVSWAQDVAVSEENLRREVEWLAAPEREGRRPKSEGWAAARDHIREAFRAVGLEPAGADGGFDQAVRMDPGPKEGTNLLGILRAPAPVDEHVVLGAHYDHLGIDLESGLPFHGADDNASGVAALLEVARVLSADAGFRARMRRDIVFAAFDLEEQGLSGSRYYVSHPSLPIDEARGMVCLDMLGRSLLDQTSGALIAFGAERSIGMRAALDRAGEASGDTVWPFGTEYVGPRSDFVWFASREIPYVFLTSGPHRDYHRVGDTADGIDVPSLARHTRLAAALAADLASSEKAPTWTGNQPDALEEARAIAAMTERVLANADELEKEGKNHVSRVQLWLLRSTNRLARSFAARGRVSEGERVVLITSIYSLVFGVVDDAPFSTMKARLERLFGK